VRRVEADSCSRAGPRSSKRGPAEEEGKGKGGGLAGWTSRPSGPGEGREEGEISFFFFQSDFEIPFSKDFEFLFIFSQNHLSQK
jgi:hypothetical protein